jgi:hypothetical protein
MAFLNSLLNKLRFVIQEQVVNHVIYLTYLSIEKYLSVLAVATQYFFNKLTMLV